MRPNILNTYKPTLTGRFRLWMTKRFFGSAAHDAARAALYQPRLFSRWYYALQNTALRGKSEWTVAERELFASCVAAKLNCDYCRISHAAFAEHAARRGSPSSVNVEGMRLSNPRVDKMATFLEKLTEVPWDLTYEDFVILKEAGISQVAIREAIAVCIVFNIGSRVGIALKLHLPSTRELQKAAPFIIKYGYKMVG